ncbi:hypothetical protein ILYODFUR_030170 [Ilyodon furcidens]|uniref:TGFBR3/Endoglin-like N-terminal domain-containing protein n=1 Tax=Ilyodon furcidens TaxID=33524 RepID=A0ABV0T2W7_9TELE
MKKKNVQLNTSIYKGLPLCFAYLRIFVKEKVNGRKSKVELHLKPIQSMRQHQKPLVFVLNSPQPVIWNVKAENLALRVQHIFHVSPASRKAFKIPLP